MWRAEPAIPSTGLPHPASSWHGHPGSIAVGHPSPWICRGKHITEAGIPRPGAVHEGIPSDAGEEGLPHHPVAGNVAVGAVIVHVAYAVTIGRRQIILRVLVVVGAGFFIP